MERGEYERLAAVEGQGWWFRGLHGNLIAAWRRAAQPGRALALLDAGCGTGGFLSRLKRTLPQARCVGVELDPLAAAVARAKSGGAIAVASIAALPFTEGSFDAIFSADVLCHRGVEPAPALASIRACLKPGGIVVLNLPAYRWLFSNHDRAVDNVRRFAGREVRALLHEGGYARIRIGYWNSLLFPLMVAQRLIRKTDASDVALLPMPVEALFRAALALEAWLGAHGLRFPFGGSILATAVRP
ncbi:MAG TPA: class I SAM-dependent methyltransferase [Stellaceae bacterium]|nr:class I SAM-dependent methyltransferase [Stellaceae bacterium]